MTVSTSKAKAKEKKQSPEDVRAIQLSVLKELTEDPNTEIKTLAEELDLPFQTVNGIVMDFVRAMVATHEEDDWPNRVRRLFNKDEKDDELVLTPKDMDILKAVVTRFHKRKLEKIEKVKVKTAGQPQSQQVVYTDTYNTNPQSQPQQQVQRPPTQEEYMKSMGFNLPSVPYMDAITLMKFCLDTTFLGPRVGQVSPFLQKFQLWKDSWLRNPGSLLAALKSDFGPQAGETVYMMFFDKLPEVEPTPSSMYQLTGMSSYRPQNQIPVPGSAPGMGMGQGGMGNPMMDFDPSNPASVMAMGDSELDKYAARILKMSYAMMMAKFQQQQLGSSFGMDGGNGQGEQGVPFKIVEDIGPNGNVIRRHRVPDYSGMYGYGQQPIQSGGNEAVVRMYEKLVDMQAEQNRVLLQKQESPNKFVEDIARDAIARRAENSDPLTQFNKVLELTQQVRNIAPQGQTKTIDELRLEKDSKLAEMELSFNMKRQDEERRMREEESKKADERLSDTIKGVGDVVNTTLGPLIQGAMASYGQGLIGKAMGVPGMPAPGMAGQGQGQGMPPQGIPQPQVVQQRVVPSSSQPQPQPKPGTFTPDQIKQMENEYRVNEEWRMIQEEKNRMAQQAQQVQQVQDVQRQLDNMPIDQLQNYAMQYRQNRQGLETEAAMVEATLARRMQFGGQPQVQSQPQMQMQMPEQAPAEEEYTPEDTNVLTDDYDYQSSAIQVPNTDSGTGYSEKGTSTLRPAALEMSNDAAQQAHMQVEVGLPPAPNQSLRPMEFGVSVNTEPVEVSKKKKTTVRKQKKVASKVIVEDDAQKVSTDKEPDTEAPDVIIDETEINQIIEE